MVSEFTRQMLGQGNATGRILDVMQQFLAVARQAADKSARHNERRSKIEQEVSGLLSRERYSRHR